MRTTKSRSLPISGISDDGSSNMKSGLANSKHPGKEEQRFDHGVPCVVLCGSTSTTGLPAVCFTTAWLSPSITQASSIWVECKTSPSNQQWYKCDIIVCGVCCALTQGLEGACFNQCSAQIQPANRDHKYFSDYDTNQKQHSLIVIYLLALLTSTYWTNYLTIAMHKSWSTTPAAGALFIFPSQEGHLTSFRLHAIAKWTMSCRQNSLRLRLRTTYTEPHDEMIVSSLNSLFSSSFLSVEWLRRSFFSELSTSEFCFVTLPFSFLPLSSSSTLLSSSSPFLSGSAI